MCIVLYTMMVLYSIIKKIVTKASLVVNLEIFGMVLYYLIIRILKCIEALFVFISVRKYFVN